MLLKQHYIYNSNNHLQVAVVGFRKMLCEVYFIDSFDLGPSINGLVTDENTKLCCRGFILALIQSNTANKIVSEHTQDYKRLLPVAN